MTTLRIERVRDEDQAVVLQRAANKVLEKSSAGDSKRSFQGGSARAVEPTGEESVRKMYLSYLFGRDNEVAEISGLLRGTFRPEDEQFASILGGVRSVHITCLEMQRCTGLVLLALVGEIALNHVERFGHTFVQVL